MSGCRRLVWLSPPSSSRVVRSRRSPGTTGYPKGGYRGYSSATHSKATRRSSPGHDGPHQPDPTAASHHRTDPRDSASTDRKRTRRRTPHHRLAPRHHHHLEFRPPPSAAIYTRWAHHTQPAERPKSAYIRFAAEQPNERWQADFTHWCLADGTHTEILCWIDDHSRYALSVTAHRRITGPIVVNEFTKTVANHGIPYSTLTDNGMVFTTRFAGGKADATNSKTNSTD